MNTNRTIRIAATAATIIAASGAVYASAPAPKAAVIPVVVVSYFPLDGQNIDKRVTGISEPYTTIKAKCDKLTKDIADALAEGSRYHGYKDPNAKPSLKYKVIGTYEFKTAMPMLPLAQGATDPMVDYNAIMKAIDVKNWVEKRGAKEVWIWGYQFHNGLFESNMASKYGNISNSDRSETVLPKCSKTYTVYTYNYGRALGEALEDHMHQVEALLNCADGRDVTPEAKWSTLLFWGKFVGSDATYHIATNPARCGWTHYAPNSEHDYDWTNKRYVETDIEDWHPDYVGKTQRMNCERWGSDPIKWRIYWLQAIPGANNGLTHNGKALRNWWTFVSDWDRARREKWTLTLP